MKPYLAAGWFTEDQEKARQEVLNACKTAKVDVYSPKEDFLYIEGKTRAVDVFTENISKMHDAPFIIASTEGKDMGTLFECGVAFTINTPIIYYYKGKGKFNLMLSESAHAVLTSYEELLEYLQLYSKTKVLVHEPYTGEKE